MFEIVLTMRYLFDYCIACIIEPDKLPLKKITLQHFTHIKGPREQFLARARLLTSAETLFTVSDKQRQIHEPAGRIRQGKQCKYLENPR